jgi:hypothetical protein
MATRAIITHQPEVSCAMCGRRLLRGERPDVFVVAGDHRTVCELCIPRAAGEGWQRASEASLQAGGRSQRTRRGRSLLDRLRQRRGLEEDLQRSHEEPGEWDHRSAERWRDASAGEWATSGPQAFEQGDAMPAFEEEAEAEPEHGAHSRDEWVDREVAHEPVAVAGGRPSAARAPAAAAPRGTSPSADLTAEQAIEIFNASECAGRIAGIARALGAPSVTVRQHEEDSDRVIVVVAWELCWYRYEVDLRERPATIALLADGTELGELPQEDVLANASADERGELSLLR